MFNKLNNIKTLNKLILTADIGGTNIRLAIVSSDSSIIAQCNTETMNHNTPQSMAEWMKTCCLSMLESSGHKISDIIAIGVCAPNANQFNGTIQNAPNLPWHGVIDLQKIIKSAFESHLPNVEVHIMNDANAAAMGEMIFGGAKDLKNFVEITIGTGLGSGIVIDRKLLLGYDSFAGELGHTIIDPSPYGRECNCGRKGCLERYVSANGIILTLNELLTYDSENECIYNIFDQYIDIDPALIENTILKIDDPVERIAEAAKKGDVLAQVIFEITANYLALSLANLVAITSTQAIFIGGGVAKAGDVLIEPTKRYFNEMLLNCYKYRQIPIQLSSLAGSDAALLGLAAYCIESAAEKK